jgi:hypothetical protein
MKPVQQRKLWRPDSHPDGPQRGDCMTACLASVFEQPYEDCEVKGYAGEISDWLKERRYAGVEAVHHLLGTGWQNPESIGDYRLWPTSHHEMGYWIAGIWSPRIPDEEKFGCGCVERVPGGDPECEWCHGEPEKRSMGIQWGLHAVVMQYGQVAWDPHPEAEDRGPDETIYFRSAVTFHVVDPAQLRRSPMPVDWAA